MAWLVQTSQEQQTLSKQCEQQFLLIHLHSPQQVARGGAYTTSTHTTLLYRYWKSKRDPGRTFDAANQSYNFQAPRCNQLCFVLVLWTSTLSSDRFCFNWSRKESSNQEQSDSKKLNSSSDVTISCHGVSTDKLNNTCKLSIYLVFVHDGCLQNRDLP